ncbi:MAG: glycerol acyltransferase [Bacteroidaceae bacterium]|nr:glycerol acyltransferase [Bacteroidaceae bacterium]
MNDAQGIDIELILKKKFGKAPRLLTWYLKHLIHQDYLNGFFVQGYTGVEFCTKALEYLDISITVEGSIPEGGPYTFVSNHPLGGVDGLALLHIIGQKNPDVMMLGNDFLTNIQGLKSMIVPVSKVGIQSRTLKDNIDQAFSSSAHILVLPAGKVSRKTDGVIQDQPWKKTFLVKSIETGRDIVPIHFIGTNSRRFYRIGRLEKYFKLRFPLGMLFLPDEMYRARGKSYRVVIGNTMPISMFDESQSIVQWTDLVRDIVYKL